MTTQCICMPLKCAAVKAYVKGQETRQCVLLRDGKIAVDEVPFPGLRCAWQASRRINPAQWRRATVNFTNRKTGRAREKDEAFDREMRGRCHYESTDDLDCIGRWGNEDLWAWLCTLDPGGTGRRQAALEEKHLL